jgi:hypothetical protein
MAGIHHFRKQNPGRLRIASCALVASLAIAATARHLTAQALALVPPDPPAFHLTQDETGADEMLDDLDSLLDESRFHEESETGANGIAEGSERDAPDESTETPQSDESGRATATDDADNESNDEDEDRRLGEAPEETNNDRAFLRSVTVLLEPGEIQFDHGFRYRLNQFDTPFLFDDGTIGLETVRTRTFLVPLSFRFGIREDLQGFVDLPFGYNHGVRADGEEDDFFDTFGLADIAFGASKILRKETKECPDVIGTLSCSVPTGDDPFGIDVNDPSLGSGFWSISANVNAVKSYDPVVLFASTGYTHFLSRRFLGSRVQLGETLSYAFGMGMSVNDDITLSTSLIGAYQPDIRLNGNRVTNTALEPISLRMAVTGTMFKCHIVEPFVTFGLSEDASSANFGLIITRL